MLTKKAHRLDGFMPDLPAWLRVPTEIGAQNLSARFIAWLISKNQQKMTLIAAKSESGQEFAPFTKILFGFFCDRQSKQLML